jgi:membrane-bound lytic murein transglycosylase D
MTGKNGSLLLIILVCALGFSSKAQYHQRVLQMMNTNSVNKKEIPIHLPDSLDDKNLDNEISQNFDSLLNTWYVKNAFKADRQKSTSRPVTFNTVLSDSVYIDRLRNLDSFIPLPFNQTVRNLIGFYTEKRPGLVSIMMGLADYYFPLFEEVLSKYNLPLELKYLPVIESALNPKAISRVKASGLWQFMFGTAKLYNLEISSFVDERFDPVKSTEAAARYLSDLYAIYGDWHVALAAYNCGPGNVNKAIKRAGGKQNYWEIYKYLPKETRGYIPTFIAATYVMNYAKDHNITASLPSFKIFTDTIKINSYFHFEQIASVLKIPIEELRQLNPQYKNDIIPAKSDKPYVLNLPQEKISSFIEEQSQIYAYNRDKYFPNNELTIPSENNQLLAMSGKKKVIYTVKKGESTASIAKKNHVTVASLIKWNNIHHNKIKAGQELAIYVTEKKDTPSKQSLISTQPKQDKAVAENLTAAKKDSIPESTKVIKSAIDDDNDFTYYTVRSGDSLYTIAKQFSGVSHRDIIALNQIKDTRGLVPGQKLKIPIRDSN